MDPYLNKLSIRYIPMTETAFYILLALKSPLHGYGIILEVEALTEGRLRLGAGTIYGTLSKMEKDGLINVVGQEERRKIYRQSILGDELLKLELERLRTLITDSERSGY
ncbi:PadR family transcriptional regulator [Fusibacter bizertensis]|uniref:PadR family transcriptional regulator n=1 Tax=Fusibacter bizertensis TaxID=1488331 RepID=A0ABT6NEG9_9FIRM|nr:PadR family transcriptional regulator [Fusibacter bizertensis]MDH8678828.1 PadR family transcriptional regulator [Fusibacter bizertensis]